MWIGANKKSGSWMWFGILTGRVPPDETHPDSDWHSGHLDDAGYDCMYYQPTSDGWNAHRYCSSSFNFVCEKRIWKYKQQRAKLSLDFYFSSFNHHLSDNQINLNCSGQVTQQGGHLIKQLYNSVSHDFYVYNVHVSRYKTYSELWACQYLCWKRFFKVSCFHSWLKPVLLY